MSFPQGTRSTAYQTIVSILKSDPILKREVKTFKAWTGDPKDLEDFSTGMEPWLKLTPHPGEMGFNDNKSHHAPFLLDLEIGLQGTNAGTIMDFWESIERAFYPISQSQFTLVQGRLQSAGIVAVEFTKAGWDVENKGGLALTGTGQVKLWFYIQNKGVQH